MSRTRWQTEGNATEHVDTLSSVPRLLVAA